MIVRMKRIFLIAQAKDAASALGSLQRLGIVHVEHQRAIHGEAVVELKSQVGQLKAIIEHLAEKPLVAQKTITQKKEFLEEISSDLQDLQRLRESILKRHQVINFWRSWGSFSPEDIFALQQKGFYVQLFRIPEAQLATLPDDLAYEKIFVQEKIAHGIAVSLQRRQSIFEEVSLPTMNLMDMQTLQEKEQRRIAALEEKMQESAVYLHALQDMLASKTSDLKLQEALAGMGEEKSLQYLKGFCPVEAVTKLQGLARRERWGLVIDEPEEEDRVPTLLRNPAWVEMIKPVFGLMNIIPGYQELDISILFLIFFSLFVGILIGDMGYGFVILLGVAFFHWKSRKRDGNVMALRLMYLLSGCAILWGAMTGVFFGQAWLPSSMKPLVPWLTDARNMQLFCFFVGALHLSFAHAWKALLKAPSVEALADIGWIMILWFMFFLAQQLILNTPLPGFAFSLVWGGTFLVVFFHQPVRNIFKRIGSGLGTLVLSIVNMFTDVVSYIRLAAVSMASLAVADALNQIALGLGFESFFSGSCVILILFLSHALNLTLGFMAIIVHGIRLNILEFSSHLGMEWSGISYEPLAKPGIARSLE